MAALGSQSIASSYEQLLHVDRNGGGDGTNLVSVKDGDNGTTFDIQLSSNSTNFQTDFQIGGTAVSSTAAELNYNDITTLGTAEASKVLTADANGAFTFKNYTNQTTISAGANANIITNAPYVADDIQEWLIYGYENARINVVCRLHVGADTAATCAGNFVEHRDPFGITYTFTDNTNGTFTVNVANGHGSISVKFGAIKIWQTVTA